MPSLPGRRTPERAERAAKRAAARSARSGRLRQLRQAWTMTRQQDRRMVPIVVAIAVGVFAVMLLIGFLVGLPVYFGVLGVLAGLLAGLSVFGRRAQRAAYAQVEGQPGAAVAVVQSMRGFWRVTPMVAFNRNQDVVHRVLGRPGVILVGEGNSARVGQLLVQEKRRVSRVAAEAPVYEVVVGDAKDQVPLRRLQAHLTKLPRNLKPAQVREVEARMRALGAAQPPIPKGPMPRNLRMPRGR